MLISLVTFYQNVIDVNFHIMANLIFEDLVDEILVSSSNVLQPKGNDFIIVQHPVSDEGHLLLILRCHFDLVVAQEYIHEAENLVPQGGVNKLVYLEQRKIIFWTGFTKIIEINIYPSFPICLLDEYNVGHVVMVVHLIDEARRHELVHLLINSLLLLWGKAYHLLSDYSI